MKALILVVCFVFTLASFWGCNGKREVGAVRVKAFGNEHGNGGDNRPPDDAAMWFTGDRVIRICIERKEEFSVSLDEVKSSIGRSFDIWKSYFQEKVLISPGVNVYADANNSPAFKFTLMEKCDQTEDLKVYLGTSDGAVEKAKSEFANPTAFAQKTSYDAKKGWGQGFIWVAPKGPDFEWQAKPNLFLAMLLHEFGHIFGCEHVDGTIMTANIVSLIQGGSVSDPSIYEPYLTQIDGNKELVLNPDAKVQIDGFGNGDSCQTLIGRQCQGAVRGQLATLSSQSVKVSLSDHIGSFELLIATEPDGARFRNEARAFKIYRAGENTVEYWVAGGAASVDYGTVTTTSGTTLDVTVERNSDGGGAGRVRVRFRSNNKLQDLFSGFHLI